MGKAVVDPSLGPEPFLSCLQRQALDSQLRKRGKVGRLLASGLKRTWLSFVIGRSSGLAELLFGMPQGLLSGGLENAIRDAELSGKLSHELLSLRGLAVTLFLSTQLPCGFAAQSGSVVGLCSS